MNAPHHPPKVVAFLLRALRSIKLRGLEEPFTLLLLCAQLSPALGGLDILGVVRLDIVEQAQIVNRPKLLAGELRVRSCCRTSSCMLSSLSAQPRLHPCGAEASWRNLSAAEAQIALWEAALDAQLNAIKSFNADLPVLGREGRASNIAPADDDPAVDAEVPDEDEEEEMDDELQEDTEEEEEFEADEVS